MEKIKSPSQIASELRRYFAEQGLVGSSGIAKATGIEQSTVHRNLFGEPRRVSKALRSLCKYANLDLVESVRDPRESTVLMEALATIWDGTDVHARRLADLLFAHNDACMRK